jgi:hypothetical protein
VCSHYGDITTVSRLYLGGDDYGGLAKAKASTSLSANLRFDGSQGANIRLTDRRVKFPCSFYYSILFFRQLLMQEEYFKILV